MNRAFSILRVKSVDEEQRIIIGTSSTPETDRGGDTMNPFGARFKLPIPFKFKHGEVIGDVFKADVSATGIDIMARVRKISEPGRLKDEVDYAWQSIKYQLAPGLSVGWNPIKAKPNKTGGLDVAEWEMLEVSAVGIPMNAGATIAAVKSADDLDLAGASASDTSAGASATTPRRRRASNMAKTTSDRIVEFRSERTTIAQKMATLMQPVVDGTGDLTAEKQTEYDDLTKDLNDVDANILRFEALERASIAPKSIPISGDTSASASDSRAPERRRITVASPELPPGIGFTRAVMCKAAARMFGMTATEVARERYPSHPEIEAYLKAAVTSQTTATDTALVTTPSTLTTEFLAFLRPKTIVGKFGMNGIPSLTSVPFNSRIQEQTTGGTGGWVGAGVQKPVTRFNFDEQTVTWAKVAGINVCDQELIRFSTPSAEARVRDGLVGVVVEVMDTTFIDPAATAVPGVSPASITSGVSATAHSGTDAAAVRTAIQAALGAFITANADVTKLVWIMPATTALSLQLMMNDLGQREFPTINMNGGTLEGFPVITSQYAATVQGSPTSNIVILVNASEIFLADDGGVNVDMSNQASIEMSDDPANDSGTLVHLFQANKVAFRAERFVTWARGRSSSVVWFTAVAWAA